MKRILSLSFVAMLCCSMFVNAESKLSDGAAIVIGNSQMTTNFLRAGDVQELVQGTMAYDPTNHVLTLTDVLIETPTSAVVGLGLGCSGMPAGSKHIEMRLVGTNYVRMQNTDANSYGMVLGGGDFSITGINGTLNIMTNNQTALGLGDIELTIKEGAYVYAGYSEDGFKTKIGVAPSLMANPIVTINCATLRSFGTEYSMAAINPGLVNAAVQDGYEYNSSLNTWTEDDHTTVVKNKAITFAPTKHIFMWMNATEEGGTISVTKNGSPLSCPYYYDDSEQETKVTITATPKANWAFAKWNNFNGYVDDKSAASTQYELPISQTGLLIASFRKTNPQAPSKPWYMLDNFNNRLYKYADLTQPSSVVIEDITSTGMTKTKVTQSTYAEDKLYYVDQDGTNVNISYVAFDPNATTSAERLKNPQVLVASQDVYQQFYALTYNAKDKHFYAVAKKSDATQYLVKIAIDGSAITEVGVIENNDINNSVGIYLLAANKQGKLYGIFKSAETYNLEASPYRHGSMFCEIDPATAAVTNIGWTGLYFETPSCAMAFDYYTGALIGTNDNGYDKWLFSIDTQTGRATRLEAFAPYNNGIFQMLSVNEAIEEVDGQASKAGSCKELRDGCLYIIKDGKTYSAQGQLIK